jgi:hypothetical protein
MVIGTLLAFEYSGKRDNSERVTGNKGSADYGKRPRGRADGGGLLVAGFAGSGERGFTAKSKKSRKYKKQGVRQVSNEKLIRLLRLRG